jgi:hypothetical protein
MKNKFKKTVYWIIMLISYVIISVFSGCKDDNNNDDNIQVIYPTKEKTESFNIEGCSGMISYDTKLKSWIINPSTESISLFKYFTTGDETMITVLIDNVQSLGNIQPGTITFSGTARLTYIEYYQNNSANNFVYTVEISNYSYADSRSIDDTDTLYYECGTPTPEPPLWFFERESSNGLDYSTSYVINIYTHFLKNVNETIADKDYSSNVILNALNRYYSETNISFSLLDSEYITSNSYNNVNPSNYTKTFKLNPHSNAVDIYVFSKGDSLGPYAGIAEYIPSTAFVVRNMTTAQTTTIAHEMGHCLGLYHTHHGTSQDEQSSSTIPELVDGSNSSYAGDYITDTPADPCTWNSNGTYRDELVDENGDHYNPDPFNIMSYSQGRTVFTEKQVERIVKTFKKTSFAYSGIYTTINNEITGPKYITSKSDYSIDIPSNYSCSGELTCETYSSLTGDPTTTTKQIDSNTCTIDVTSTNATSQKYKIKWAIETPKGYNYTISKVIYNVTPSDETGNFTWSSESSSGNYGGRLYLNASNSQSPVKVYQGGMLYFYYSDASGSKSISDDEYYNFTISNDASFTKDSNTNNAYKCNDDAQVGSHNSTFILNIGGRLKIISLPITILKKSTTSTTSLKDSLEVIN